MVGFRLVALGYALLVLLIAPSWLSASEEPSTLPVPAVEDAAEVVQETVPDVPALDAQAPAVETVEGVAPEPASDDQQDRKRKADTAKAAKAKQSAAKKDDEPVAKTAANASVTIRDFEFDPANVTINEGDTITWTNDGPTIHTATAEDGSFDTGTLRKGESGSATFTSAGTIKYICTPHPNMKGTIVVQAASAGSDGGSGSSTGSGSDTGSSDTGVAGDSTSSDTGSSLPSTGLELLSIFLLGAATLGFGLVLRRRGET